MIERRHLWPGAAAFAASSLMALIGLYASAEEPREAPAPAGVVKLRLLGVNDFHGHLEPPKPGVGGAAWLKAGLDRSELAGRTIRVHAGDMVGASPLISSWFHDEPAIEVANALGFDVGTVGNHEFDEGGDELLRLLSGGRRSGAEALKRDVDGRLVNTSSPAFAGARFPYLAANTTDREGRLALPPQLVIERAGVRVGFIGVTTPATPRWLLARHSERFRFGDISDAVNREVPALRRQGVEAIVVLAHAGAQTPPGMDPRRASGEIIAEARQMSDAVDVVVAGHTHSRLNLRIGGKLIAQAGSYGAAYEVIDLAVDRRTGDVVEKSAIVRGTEHERGPGDAGVGALVERYAQRVGPLARTVLGQAGARLSRRSQRLGKLTAEAQRAFARADAALVSNDSFRGDFETGPITYADVARVQGYDHRLVRVRLSGRELARLRAGAGDGFHWSGPGGGSIDPGASYTVAASEMLATGDAVPLLRDAPGERSAAGSEVEALAWYLERQAPAR